MRGTLVFGMFSLLFHASAWAISPSDFFCRPLSGAGTAAMMKGLQGQAFTWDEKTSDAWNNNPTLQAEIGKYLQRVAGDPKFFSGGAGACVAPGARAKGTCQQTVECAFVDRKLQQQVEQTYANNNQKKKSFADMDPASKESLVNLLKLDGMLDWKLSTVTCAASGDKENGVPVCPPADLCKADVGADGSVATTSLKGLTQQNAMGVVNFSDPTAGSSK